MRHLPDQPTIRPPAAGPLLRARRFVLVGDPHQLPPLVTSKQAEAEGMGQSLFARLAEAHPQARCAALRCAALCYAALSWAGHWRGVHSGGWWTEAHSGPLQGS
jgi:hypothetical protein